MIHYIRKYPFSLAIIAVVVYLSFFNPPHTEIESIPNIDKLVHFCMYFAMSGMLWMEFLRSHRTEKLPLRHAVIGAVVCPIVFSGCIELLQEYCTTYRGGDWMDFAANAAGVLAASYGAYRFVRPFITKK